MKRAILFLAAASSIATASTDPVKDSRTLSAAALCGATNAACVLSYTNGSKDTSAAYKRVLSTYKAIRAAEVVPLPVPPPSPPPPAPVPAPTPAPLPLTGLDPVADGLDVASLLKPTWGTGQIPNSAAPDTDGAFRFICQAGQISYDDPIVYPGQPGKSHLHQFFGNDLANAHSTYSSLRTTGGSTCMNPLNRSAYWMPAMMNGKGQVVRPDYVSIYYKRRPASDPACMANGQKGCIDLPRGLRFIFGFNMLNQTQQATGRAYFNCDGPTAVPGQYPDIVTAAKNCPIGNRLGFIIAAPQCWDGKNLDSADHRSHVAYASNSGWGDCPVTHPYVIPTFTMGVWFTVDDTLDRSGVWDGTLNSWHLSSDEADAMPGMIMPVKKPGTTIHADWFGAWNDATLAMWAGNCINKLLNCSAGDLGNGKQLRQLYADSWTATPHLVPAPARPVI